MNTELRSYSDNGDLLCLSGFYGGERLGQCVQFIICEGGMNAYVQLTKVQITSLIKTLEDYYDGKITEDMSVTIDEKGNEI